MIRRWLNRLLCKLDIFCEPRTADLSGWPYFWRKCPRCKRAVNMLGGAWGHEEPWAFRKSL